MNKKETVRVSPNCPVLAKKCLECTEEKCYEDCEVEEKKEFAKRYEVKTCRECGVGLIPPESGLCSLCVSSGEHIGDLGWKDED